MKATCIVEGCDRKFYAKSACRVHYSRFKKFGSYDLPPRQVDLPCSVPTCDRNAKASNLCGGHYRRLVKNGDVDATRPLEIQGRNSGACSVPDCVRLATAVGMCHTHRGRVRKFGDAMADLPLMYQTPMAGTVCTINGCDREGKSRGLCRAHYLRWRKGQDLSDARPIRKLRKNPEPCSVKSCDILASSLGWRSGHYQRWVATGDVRPKAPLSPRRKMPPGTCSVEGCGDPRLARGMCRIHYYQIWRVDNADKLRNARHRRRTRMAGNPTGQVTEAGLLAKVEFWGRRCWMCHGPYEAIDHVKPVVAGGGHLLCNLRPACTRCNSSKGTKWPYPTNVRAAA